MRGAVAAFAVFAFALSLDSASGSRPAVRPEATSLAFAIKIVVPNQPDAISAYVTAPKNDSGYGTGFSYPADGAILTSGAVTSNAAADSGAAPTASAGAQVTDLTLFGGEVTVQRVNANVVANASDAGASGDFSGSGVTGIAGSAVLGNRLGDWGRLTLGAGKGRPRSSESLQWWSGAVTALDV